MIKRERITDFLKSSIRKFFPLFYIALIAGTFTFIIWLQQTQIQIDEKRFNQFIQKNIYFSSKSDIVPLSIESTRAFYFISQILQESGFLRCDFYRPDSGCQSGRPENNTLKFFNEIREAVFLTPAGYEKAGSSPPYHTLKGFEINMGTTDSDYIGVLLYTGKNAGLHISRLLNYIRYINKSKEPCKGFRYAGWYLIEDPYFYGILENKFSLTISDRQSPVQVFKRDSTNHWKPSINESINLLKYLNEDEAIDDIQRNYFELCK